MEKEDLDKIRGWFNQVLQETSKIKKQNFQTLDWMEPTYLNVKGIYDKCDALQEKVDKLENKLRNLEYKIDTILDKLD